MTLELVGASTPPDERMIVAVNEATGALGSWRWNMKRHRHIQWETAVNRERANPSRANGMQAAEVVISAEPTRDRSDSTNDS